MITTKFYLDTRRKSESGEYPLRIAIRRDRKTLMISINVKLDPKYWNQKKQRVIGPAAEDLNQQLSLAKSKMDSAVMELQLTGKSERMSLEEIRDIALEAMFGEMILKSDPTLFGERLKSFAGRKTESTKRIYMSTWGRIVAWLGERRAADLRFEDITLQWLRDFDAFLSKTSRSKNGRNIHFRNIRAIFNDALDDEVISCYPFRKFKIRPEPTRKRALTVEELRDIFTMEVEPYAEIYRDMFKLIFFLIGINTIDLYNLKTVSKEGRIEFSRAKTHRLYSIKVEPEAMAIIEEWKGKTGLLRIADRWESHVQFRKQFNKALRLMGAPRTGLGGKKGEGKYPQITSYWARHSWATVAASLDIPKETIAAALGHGGNTVTDIYIDFDQRKVDEANRKVIDWVLYGKK